MIKVQSIYLEPSKVNKQQFILVVIDEQGNKWVCSGDHYSPTYVVKYEEAFDTKPLK